MIGLCNTMPLLWPKPVKQPSKSCSHLQQHLHIFSLTHGLSFSLSLSQPLGCAKIEYGFCETLSNPTSQELML